MLKFPRSIPVLGLLFVSTLFAGVPTSPAAQTAELHCRHAIAGGLAKWLKGSLKARLACQSDVILGARPPGTDCITGSGTSGVQGQLADASRRLSARLERVCTDANWGLLSYPGPCGGPGPFSAATLTDCLTGIGTEITSDFFDVWYPFELDVTDAVEADCLRTVPRRATAMFLREMRARLQCLLEFEESAGISETDCRAQMVPYGAGSGDEALDREILRAQDEWLTGFPRSCAEAEFASLGYGELCPDEYDSGSEILDLQTCVFHTNRQKVPVLVDLAFPSAPVCGNGIRQEGEECDNGPLNSDTAGDACRTDCVLPFCGDGTADPGNDEGCDDGNANSLDGCTPACVLEFCGDGQVNDLPDEDCDDGNSNQNDRCTSCTDATCGDGVVCSHASCTTGPGGGVEQCDLGAANSASGLCRTDCSGFNRGCTLTIGVTNAVLLGALTYDLVYEDADGEVLGSGSSVQCTSLITSGLVSFFDNENRRKVRESLIINAGVQTPVAIATCEFGTSDAGLNASDFSFSIEVASDPSFNPVGVTLAVTNVDCD